MKLNRVSCTQFAGMTDRDIRFEDGLNVIFGENESGKSTLAALLTETLFRSVKLSGATSTDRSFSEQYFPVARRGAAAGDFIDGKVYFDTADGSFTLSKTWGEERSVRLTTPDGVLSRPESVEQVLQAQLGCGQSVYRELLLSTQRGSDASLEALLAAAGAVDAKKELAKAAAEAFAETGAIPAAEIGAAIDEKIAELTDEHWDETQNRPQGNKRWVRGCGRVHTAYYALLDAQDAQKAQEEAELAAERSTRGSEAAKAAADAAKETYDSFGRTVTRLKTLKSIREQKSTLQRDADKLRKALAERPALDAAVREAEALRQARADRELLDRYGEIRNAQEKLAACEAAMEGLVCPTREEIDTARKALDRRRREAGKLGGMHLAAQLQMQNGHTVQVRSVRTGELLEGELTAITEAVRITVPEVMELTLSPADVDVAAVTETIAGLDRTVQELFDRYQVSSVEEMEDLLRDFSAKKTERDNARTALQLKLGGDDAEALAARAAALPTPVREKAEIDAQVRTLCGMTPLDSFCTEQKTLLQRNREEYGDDDAIRAAIADNEARQRQLDAEIAQAEDIPAEYREIRDPDAHWSMLQQRAESLQNAALIAHGRMREDAQKLSALLQQQTGDPAEQVERAQREFDDAAALLRSWRHIKSVFDRQRALVTGRPLERLSAKFAENLAALTGGRVSATEMAGDEVVLDILSRERPMNFSKLSEGTKETVSLAFRLAVLDHLFPEGGGVAVFDDPLVNMDEGRAERACALLQQYSQRHQILFMTCRESYFERLGGNLIRI